MPPNNSHAGFRTPSQHHPPASHGRGIRQGPSRPGKKRGSGGGQQTILVVIHSHTRRLEAPVTLLVLQRFEPALKVQLFVFLGRVKKLRTAGTVPVNGTFGRCGSLGFFFDFECGPEVSGVLEVAR